MDADPDPHYFWPPDLVRIRIRVKSRIRNRIKVEIQELQRLKMKPCRAVDTQNRGVAAQNGALEDLYPSGSKL
jgi:hypothetical protein